MPAGFVVNPELLGVFTGKVDKIIKNYDEIIAWLTSADVASDSSKMATLVADPGHSGGPADFAESCRTMLTSYGTLMHMMLRTHTAAKAHLKYIYDNVNAASSLYAELEQRNAEMFQKLLADFSPEERRGDDGTA